VTIRPKGGLNVFISHERLVQLSWNFLQTYTLVNFTRNNIFVWIHWVVRFLWISKNRKENNIFGNFNGSEHPIHCLFHRSNRFNKDYSTDFFRQNILKYSLFWKKRLYGGGWKMLKVCHFVQANEKRASLFQDFLKFWSNFCVAYRWPGAV
jgi:hypothetical protein